MTITRIHAQDLPLHLMSWVALDSHHLPRFWATVWEALHGAGLEQTTVASKLMAIDRFYKHVNEATGRDCLDQILNDGDVNNVESLLESFFLKIRNESIRSKTDRGSEWDTAFQFVRDIIERTRQLHKADDLDIFRAKIDRLNRLYGTLSPTRSAKRKIIRALPSSVLKDLYEIVDPTSPRNIPFARKDNVTEITVSLFSICIKGCVAVKL